MRKIFKNLLKLIFYSSSLTLIIISLLGIITQTEYFRNYLRSYLLNRLNRGIKGEIFIGKFYGGLFTGLSIDGISINIDGKPFIRIPQVELRYDPLRIFSGKFSFSSVILYRPEIYLLRGVDGEWNFRKLARGSKGARSGSGFSIFFGRLKIESGRFVFVDSTRNPIFKDTVFNPSSFRIGDIIADVRGVISSDKLDLRIRELAFTFNNSLLHGKFSGDLYLDENELRVERANLVSDGSRFDFNFLARSRDKILKFERSSLEKINFYVDLSADRINLFELVKFIPHMDMLNGAPSVKFEVSGDLKNLKLDKLELKFLNSDISLKGNLRNIIDFDSFYIHVDILNSRIFADDLRKLLWRYKIPDFSIEEPVFIRASYNGHPFDFGVDVEIRSSAGEIEINGRVIIEEDIKYDLKFETRNFNPYVLSGLAGSVNLSGILKGQGISFPDIFARANISISSSRFGKFIIPESRILAEVQNDELFSTIIFSSPAFRGLIDANLRYEDGGGYSMFASGLIDAIDLSKIYLDRRLKSNLSGEFNMSYKVGDFRYARIQLRVNPSTFRNYSIRKLTADIEYVNRGEDRSLTVESNMFNLRMDGKFEFGDLMEALKGAGIILRNELKDRVFFASSDVGAPRLSRSVEIEYWIRFKNLSPIAVFAIGKIFNSFGTLRGSLIYDSSGVYFYVDGKLRKFYYLNVGEGTIDTLEIDKLNFIFEMSGWNSGMDIKLDMDVADLIPPGGLKRQFDGYLSFRFTGDKDKGRVYLDINSKFGKGEGGTVIVYGDMMEAVNRYIVSELDLRYKDFILESRSDIHVVQTDGGVNFDPFNLYLNGEKLDIFGFIDSSFQEFKIVGRNIELESFKFKELSGRGNFDVLLSGINGKLLVNFKFDINNLMYKNIELGRFTCRGNMRDKIFSIYSKLDMDVGDSVIEVMDVKVKIPLARDISDMEEFQGKVKLNGFPLAVIEPLFPNISNISGDLDSDIIISGRIDSPYFNGNFSINDGGFRFTPTGKFYLISGRGELDSNRIYFKDLILRNKFEEFPDGMLRIDGYIVLAGYRPERGELNIDGKLLISDKDYLSFNSFYGRIVALVGDRGLTFRFDSSGSVLTGDIILEEADISFPSRRSGSGARFDSEFEYVYVKPDTDYIVSGTMELVTLIHLNQDSKVDKVGSVSNPFSRVIYELKFSTFTRAKLNLILNPQTGEELMAEMAGEVDLRTEEGEIVAYGEVELLEGSYYRFFKKFDARGKIRFVRDILNPELDIEASYKGTHYNSDTTRAGVTEDVIVKLLVKGTKERPNVKFKIYVDGEERGGDVEADAIAFIITGRFKDELTGPESATLASDLWRSTGPSVLSQAVSGFLTDILRDVSGGFITGAEINYTGRLKGLRVTSVIGRAIIELGGEIFTDISRTNISVQYPLWGNLMLEYQRRSIETIQSLQEREMANTLKIYYRIKL